MVFFRAEALERAESHLRFPSQDFPQMQVILIISILLIIMFMITMVIITNIKS